MKRHPEARTSKKLAGEPGFELGLPVPESGVLPLDDSPVARGPKKIG
ncbi:unnamed protein product, partial [marine sediment metagenome]